MAIQSEIISYFFGKPGLLKYCDPPLSHVLQTDRQTELFYWCHKIKKMHWHLTNKYYFQQGHPHLFLCFSSSD